jgi:hypothetical protein
MPGVFRQVVPGAGVDDSDPKQAKIIVPWHGENVVMLQDGPNLTVDDAKLKPAVTVGEITDLHSLSAFASQQFAPDYIDAALALYIMKKKYYRFFKITGHSLVGEGGVVVQAINSRTRSVEATLKVRVLGQRPLKISIRPTQVLDGARNPVDFTRGPFDARALRDQMNAVWTPQANVAFELVGTEPALIGGATPESEGADIENEDTLKSCRSQAKNADLTFFLVQRAYDGFLHGPGRVDGVTHKQFPVSLIGNSRSETTMAHEAGHFLGSRDESGKVIREFTDQGIATDLLMRAGGAAWRIPFDQVSFFNKRFK